MQSTISSRQRNFKVLVLVIVLAPSGIKMLCICIFVCASVNEGRHRIARGVIYENYCSCLNSLYTEEVFDWSPLSEIELNFFEKRSPWEVTGADRGKSSFYYLYQIGHYVNRLSIGSLKKLVQEEEY